MTRDSRDPDDPQPQLPQTHPPARPHPPSHQRTLLPYPLSLYFPVPSTSIRGGPVTLCTERASPAMLSYELSLLRTIRQSIHLARYVPGTTLAANVGPHGRTIRFTLLRASSLRPPPPPPPSRFLPPVPLIRRDRFRIRRFNIDRAAGIDVSLARITVLPTAHEK